MLKNLLVALIILYAGNLFYTQSTFSAFEEACSDYALITTPELSQFDTSDLGKTPGDMLRLSREYGEEVLDIQISMPTIADSLIGDPKPLPRNDTFKLVFTEALGRIDDFACGNRVLLSGADPQTLSLDRGECLISSTLAETNGLRPGDSLTLVHYFNWSFRFTLVVRDVFEDHSRPVLDEFGGYTSRRNEVIASMETLLANARVVSILQSRQVHAKYLVRLNSQPVTGADSSFVLPLCKQYDYLVSKQKKSFFFSLQLLVICGLLLACLLSVSHFYQRDQERECLLLLSLYRVAPPRSQRLRRILLATVTIVAVLLCYPFAAPFLEKAFFPYDSSFAPLSAGNAILDFLRPCFAMRALIPHAAPASALLLLPWITFLWFSGRPRTRRENLLLHTDAFSAPCTVIYCTSEKDIRALLSHNDAFTIAPDIHLTVREYYALFGLSSRDLRSMSALPFEENLRIQLEIAARFHRSRIVLWNRSHVFEDHLEALRELSFTWIVLTGDIMLECDDPVWGWRDGRLMLIR